MRRIHMPIRGIAVAACAVALATSCVAAEVSALSIESGGRPLAVTRYAAAGTAARPGVMVLHGASGLDAGHEAYAHYARLLAANGIDAYLLDYFGPRATWTCGCWSIWAAKVLDVAAFVARSPQSSGRVGVLGFSLGGGVAIESAADPRIRALAVLYPSIPNKVEFARPPPLLVLQGDADRAAPLPDSEALVRLARQSGGRAELVVYPGEGHRLSTWQQAAATDATERMIAFFRAELTAPSVR
jgi:carboxymethylenebutenolidase